MVIHQSLVKVFSSIALVVAFSAQSLTQTPQQPTRQPDPARIVAPMPAAQFKAPETIDFRSANAYSEGVRLHVELFSPKALAGKPLPTIIQAHGWGGTAAK